MIHRIFFQESWHLDNYQAHLKPILSKKSLLRLFNSDWKCNIHCNFLGTPNSPILILGSGVITLLALKSTRFPIRFPLTRPPFPTKRSLQTLKHALIFEQRMQPLEFYYQSL